VKRIEAIEAIISVLDDQLVVHANGMISRESFHTKDRQANFYMIGSMGLNSAIGLGLAVGLPERTIVVLDGDGSVLMNLGILASIGDLGLKNLVHIVLDNESYSSTGGQRCISDRVHLERFATAAGYQYVSRIDSAGELAIELDRLWRQPRPAFVLIKVELGNEPNILRVPFTPPDIKRRFMQSLITRR
jgi:thiamine pyrophosphate-dependent acetolactate synthase large subunit-like protein